MGSFYLGLRQSELENLITISKSNSNDDTPEMNEIIRRFEKTAQSVAAGITPNRDLQGDLANAGRLGVVVAVRNHKNGTAGFPNYAKAYIVGAAKRELRHWITKANLHQKHRIGLDDEIDSNTLLKILEQQHPTRDLTWGSAQTTKTVNQLSPAQRALMKLRFIEDMALADIAAITGTSKSAVSQRIRTALNTLERTLAA